MPLKEDLEVRIQGAMKVDVWDRFFDETSFLYDWTILQQEWLNISIRQLFRRGRARCLENFDRFMTDSVRKSAFDFLIQHPLETRTKQYKWAVKTPIATVFERNTFPVPIRDWLEKQGPEDIPPEAIRLISYVDSEEYYDLFLADAFLAYSMGGQVAFAEFNIPIRFEMRDPLVEFMAESSTLRLSSSISSQISDRIKAELLEGLRNGEAMELLRDRVNRVWDRPLVVNVDPLVDPISGNILRRGYSYTMSADTWSSTTSRTEVLRWFNDGKLEAYKQAGVRYVQYTATDDHLTCPDCIAYHDQVYTVAESAGLLPLHCRCRCTWRPVIGEPEFTMFEIAGVTKRVRKAKIEVLLKPPTQAQYEKVEYLANLNAVHTYSLAINFEEAPNPFRRGIVEYEIFEMMRGGVERKPLEAFVLDNSVFVDSLEEARETIRRMEQCSRAKNVVIARLKEEEYSIAGAIPM